MTIHIEQLEILAIIGILDFERVEPQKVVVDLSIKYPYKKDRFINYAEVIDLIQKMIIEKKYELLEDALNEIQCSIVEKYPQIINLKLKISKPNIIKNANVALSLEWFSPNLDN